IPLVRSIYSAENADHAEALAFVALELLGADDGKLAEAAADQALAVYAPDRKPRPRLRAPVVALAVALKKAPPQPEKGSVEDERQELIGQAEGLARPGQWPQAREKVSAAQKYEPEVRFRAAVGVAAAAVESKAGDKADLE